MDFAIRPIEGNDNYQEALSQVTVAEECGFDCAYLAEHYGFPKAAYWPSTLLGLAGFATQTHTIRLGTAISILPLVHPLHLASSIAFLDVIADGRTVFGFGAGWRESEFDAFGIPFSERGERMTECLRILNRVFDEGATSYDGKFHQFTDFRLSPEPIQSKPEFLVGGTSANAYRRATELAEGWISPGRQLDKTVSQVEQFHESGGGKTVIATTGLVVRESRSEARSLAREFIRLRQQQFQVHREEDNPHVDDATSSIDIDEHIEQELLIAGDPDDCIKQIQRLIDRTNADELILFPTCHGWGQSNTLTTIRMFGDEVIPAF